MLKANCWGIDAESLTLEVGVKYDLFDFLKKKIIC